MNGSKEKAVRWDLPDPVAEEEHTVDSSSRPSDEEEEEEVRVAETADNAPSSSLLSQQASTGVITIQHENEEWELTWPIYHMLPRQERKELAFRHGFSTIGDFEEFMTLQRALVAQQNSGMTTRTTNPTAGVSSVGLPSTPYSNASIYPTSDTAGSHVPKEESSSDSDEDSSFDGDDNDDDDDDDDERQEESSEAIDTTTATTTTADNSNDNNDDNNDNELEDLIRHGGMIRLLLPEELFAYICEYLPIHQMATLAYVSPYWKVWTRQEHIYKRLCERYYLQQCHRSQLRPHKFQNSYRIMLEQRPRVKAGGGVYVLRCARVKPILRDMTTQIPAGAILETVYYRYIYFCERHHKCLYALSTSPPEIVLKRLHKVYLQASNGGGDGGIGGGDDNDHHPYDTTTAIMPESTTTTTTSSLRRGKKKTHHRKQQKHIVTTPKATDDVVVWGAYKVHRDTVIVQAKQEWQMVQFRLQIHATYEYYRNLYHASGRFGVLSMIQHRSYPNNSVYNHLENDVDKYNTNNQEEYNIDIENETRWNQPDVCNYPIVEEVFRFIPDARF